MARKTATEDLQEKYEGKTVTIVGTEEGDITGVVTAVESDGTLEVTLENGEEYIIDPNDFKIEIGEVVAEEIEGIEEDETEIPPEELDVPEITAADIRKIDDKGILKKLIKENNLKPALSVYKTAEAMQEFLIAELTNGEAKKEQVKQVATVQKAVVKEPIVERKTTAVKPKQETAVKKTEPKAKVEKVKKVSITEFVCNEIKKGDFDHESLKEKVRKNFDNVANSATYYQILRIAKYLLK